MEATSSGIKKAVLVNVLNLTILIVQVTVQDTNGICQAVHASVLH